MLEIKYQNTTKEVPCDWNEITIKEFHGMYQVIYKYEDHDIENDEHMKMKFIRDFAAYILKEKPRKIMQMNPKDVEHLVAATHKLLETFEPENISGFEFEGEWYYFPKNQMKDIAFGEFIETSSLDKTAKLMKNGRFDVISEQMARLCKRADEVNDYLDEDVVKERTELFDNLPMNIVWEFCFFLSNQTNILVNILRTYGVEKQEHLNKKEQEKS